MKKFGVLVAAFGLLAFLPAVTAADVINLTPADADCVGTKGNAAAELAFAETCGGTFDLTLGYKDNVGGNEEGDFADDYVTVFTPNEQDPTGGTITFNGTTAFDCPVCILVVVDGAGRPIYGFNLGDWDGGVGAGQVITLSGFYADDPNVGAGAISHIGIYSGEGDGAGDPAGQAIGPEPASLLLFGTGLAFVAARARSRRRQG